MADNRENTNVLVLAGPGSGKTRVLVHRIAYLVRARRENPRSILALAYNRHAAVQIRQRLHDLIGEDANGVTVLTCHALAMRLSGSTFARSIEETDAKAQTLFDDVLKEAIDLLEGRNVAPDEADEQRDRLLAGFRWILVDEYQDIKELEYKLLSALAGRTKRDQDQRLNLFAVGDDDQNIYSFSGSSSRYIKRFEEDYRAKPSFLTENYRSTGHIIQASNTVIEPADLRMKVDYPITINRIRARERLGGVWEGIDPVTQGKVQILPAGCDRLSQAQVVVQELKRMESLDPEWDWSRCAVIARNWDLLDPVRARCHLEEIPVQDPGRISPPRGSCGRLRTAQLDQRAREPVEGRGPRPLAPQAAGGAVERPPHGVGGELRDGDEQRKSCRRPPFENGLLNGLGTAVDVSTAYC